MSVPYPERGRRHVFWYDEALTPEDNERWRHIKEKLQSFYLHSIGDKLYGTAEYDDPSEECLTFGEQDYSIIRQKLESKNFKDRIVAMDMIGYSPKFFQDAMRREHGFEGVIEMLDDIQFLVRETAMETLSKWSPADHFKTAMTILQEMQQEPDNKQIRRIEKEHSNFGVSVTNILGKASPENTENAVNVLRRLVKDKKLDIDIRMSAFANLLKLGRLNKDVTENIIMMLKNENDVEAVLTWIKKNMIFLNIPMDNKKVNTFLKLLIKAIKAIPENYGHRDTLVTSAEKTLTHITLKVHDKNDLFQDELRFKGIQYVVQVLEEPRRWRIVSVRAAPFKM